MLKRTSHAHFSSVSRHLAECAKYRDRKRLEAYVQSDAFTGSLSAMNAADRLRAANALTDAKNRCRERLNREKPIPRAGTVRVSWKGNDELIAKAIRLAPLISDNEEYARALGIPVQAARAARYKFAGTKTAGADATQQHQR